MPGDKKPPKKEADTQKRLSIRNFLVAGGTFAAVDALIAATPAKAVSPPPAASETSFPASKGYRV